MDDRNPQLPALFVQPFLFLLLSRSVSTGGRLTRRSVPWQPCLRNPASKYASGLRHEVQARPTSPLTACLTENSFEYYGPSPGASLTYINPAKVCFLMHIKGIE